MQLHSSILGPVLCPFGRVVLFYYEDRLPIRSAHITGRAKNTRLSIFTCDGPLPLERCVFNVVADNENSFSPPRFVRYPFRRIHSISQMVSARGEEFLQGINKALFKVDFLVVDGELPGSVHAILSLGVGKKKSGHCTGNCFLLLYYASACFLACSLALAIRQLRSSNASAIR